MKASQDIPLIRIDAVVPKSKTAVREALDAAPDHVYVVFNDEGRTLKQVTDLKPGESVAFTDGEGRYYGTITKTLDGKAFNMDARPVKESA